MPGARAVDGTAIRVAVVIVNYRTAQLAVRCLASLQGEVEAWGVAEVFVVDNDSQDDSCAFIDAAIASHGWGSWVRLLRSPVNGGFGAGNNFAIRHILSGPGPRPDAFWLLNPDTQVEPGALPSLVAVLSDHPRAGIVGSLLLEGDGQPWPYAFRFPSWLSEAESGLSWGPVSHLLSRFVVPRRMGPEPTAVDWVSGASMMLRRDVFETVGLMDEGFFLYFEEIDLARRSAAAGWESWFAPASAVLHLAGQSTGVTSCDASRRRRPAYWFESRRRYFIKHHGRLYAAGADLVYLAGRLVFRARIALLRRPNPDPPWFILDLLRHSALFKGTRQPAAGAC